MGFKTTDLYPSQVSTITPPSKDVRVKAFAIRGQDAATATYVKLPAGSSIVDVVVAVKTTANATNSTISVGAGGVTNNLISALSNTVATLTRASLSTYIAETDNPEVRSDITITAQGGGAAATNGVAVVMVYYVN